MSYYSAIAFSALFFFAHFQSNVAADPQLGDMEPLYVFTPGPAPGNCDNYKSDLLIAFRESIDMLTRSTAAIMYLNQPMPGIVHPLNRRKWKAWAQLMLEVYNIKVDTKTGLQLPNSPAQGILDNFNALINAHNYVPPGSGPYKYWFFCSDDYLEYKSPPTAEEMASWNWPPSMDVWPPVVQANGYWNATGGTAAHPLSGVRVPANQGHTEGMGYLCSRTNANGFVMLFDTANAILTFCPSVFTGTAYSTAAKVINSNMFKKSGATIEDLRTWGSSMIHEWGHLVLYFDDEVAVDFFGKDLGTPGNWARIYGWGRTTQTAKFYPDRVRKTPDGYLMWSMAVYYTEINKWGLQYVTGLGRYWIRS